MLQRGRKSAKALELAPVIGLERIVPPPDDMPPDQAKTWLVVARSPIFSLIGQESYPLLAEYCRLVSTADAVAKQVDEFDVSWLAEEDGLRRWEKLLKLQVLVAGRIADLAMKLRISPSSRNNRDKAVTLYKKGAARKPWETDNED